MEQLEFSLSQVMLSRSDDQVAQAIEIVFYLVRDVQPYLRSQVMRLLAALLALALLGITPTSAHQPVFLEDRDTTASKGPLLVDGTVSFAVQASFAKAGQKKAFRAALKDGDQLAVQYLIIDQRPSNGLKNSLLPQVTITAPDGKKTVMKINERTLFYEKYTSTNYFYLSRLKAPAKEGIYSFTITARAKSAVTIAVGEREIPGDVVRGPMPAPSSSPN